jgi:hypothetical protein
MAEDPYIRLPKIPLSSLWIVFWALVFFLLINVFVWGVFDRFFWTTVGFDRLVMQPSDNEIRSMIDKIKQRDQKNIVLLGDSIIWGVGINDYGETIAAKLQDSLAEKVVNLSVPGNSFFDMTATIEEVYNEDDVYLFFVNSMLFDDYYALRGFEESVRFKGLVTKRFADDHEEFLQCCDINIPQKDPFIEQWIDDILYQWVPLYRNRDLVTKFIIGLHPSVASDALVHRFVKYGVRIWDKWDISGFSSLVTRKPMMLEYKATEKETIDITNSRMISIVQSLTERLRDKKNVYFVILDDNRFKKDHVQDKNIRAIESAIQSDQILNLYRKIPSEHFLDSVHIRPSGYEIVATQILDFITPSPLIPLPRPERGSPKAAQGEGK